MNAPRHTLHIVSGKGGMGRTTVAAGLACALATRGRRVLLCEVEKRQGLSELFGVPPLQGDEERRLTRTPTGGSVFGLSIDAEDALREYLETFYHLGLAGRALEKVAAGEWRPLVSTYPLADAARAHAELEGRQALGKVVLVSRRR